MGNTSTNSVVPEMSISVLPFINYLNRKESFVLNITQQKTQKFRFSPKLEFYEDSALGYINDTTVIIAGGTNSKGKLSKKCYLIDLSLMTIKKISSLPINSKLGTINLYKDLVYYAGGVTECLELQKTKRSKEGSPLMRYSLIDDIWEVFSHQPQSVDLSNINAEILPIYWVEDLIYSGTFLLGCKIYYYGGFLLTPEETPNRYVFSVVLDSDSYDFSIEPYEFPLFLKSPISSSNCNQAFICNGMSILDKPNLSCYIFTEKKGFTEITSPDIYSKDNYPPKVTDEYIIAVAFPKFAIKFKNSQGWMNFNVSLNLRLRSPSIIISEKLNTSSNSKFPLLHKGTIGKKSNSILAISQSHSQLSFSTKNTKSFVNSIKLRLAMSSPEHEIEEELNNSLETKRKDLNVKYANSLLVSDELQMTMIVGHKNDGYIKIQRKKAVKFVKVVVKVLENKEINPLEFSKLSYSLGFKSIVSVNDIQKSLNQFLVSKTFEYKKVRKLLDILYKILETSKSSKERFDEISFLLDIPLNAKKIDKEKCILLLTRAIKSLNS
ncbi:hypothetical protein SteCoe_31119 [Stentor coeruleus]|uniref:Uncharacterized protein n=1 Tax=Stentor coeruleus TaxID=5963 RepID=A0A1R2B241_9CILI|nr:hypothetical protein SteCoe_31119 [Stentor coeruleus]